MKDENKAYLVRVRINGVAVDLNEPPLSKLCFSPPQLSMYCTPPYILDTTDPIPLSRFYSINRKMSHQEKLYLPLKDIQSCHDRFNTNMAVARWKTGPRYVLVRVSNTRIIYGQAARGSSRNQGRLRDFVTLFFCNFEKLKNMPCSQYFEQTYCTNEEKGFKNLAQ